MTSRRANLAKSSGKFAVFLTVDVLAVLAVTLLCVALLVALLSRLDLETQLYSAWVKWVVRISVFAGPVAVSLLIGYGFYFNKRGEGALSKGIALSACLLLPLCIVTFVVMSLPNS